MNSSFFMLFNKLDDYDDPEQDTDNTAHAEQDIRADTERNDRAAENGKCRYKNHNGIGYFLIAEGKSFPEQKQSA